ncbi:carboxylesterase/lipase family protein [Antribacter gilvus]|uniref:carboxylesterase/lipase family protein n=1 Tax=Antribacter gilvus TaxID=2304675 RepID=UPI0013E026EF|nr:carboxylesterase/lipase family protein [Antribacter gilvus]
MATTTDGGRAVPDTGALVRTTDTGEVQGLAEAGTLQWRGIPYAAPPVGDLRLRAPQPAEPWTGVRDATRFGAAAPQPPGDSLTGVPATWRQGEDCLTLTVVASEGPAEHPRPVIVYLHGGAFLVGSGGSHLYRGEGLVRATDVVYVSVNYRLGALGWLDLSAYGTAERPVDTNVGLRDQIAALQWVQRNIAAFGGDPAEVTVMGESAGASSALAILASPLAGGLVRRAIVQSGFSDARPREQAARAAEGFVDELGGPAALFDAEPAAFVAAMDRLIAAGGGNLPVGPTLDDDALPVDPVAALRDGAAADVPLLIGTNRDEGRFFQKQASIFPTSAESLDRLLGTGPAADGVRAAYRGYRSRRTVAARMGGDAVFWASSVAAAAAQSAHAPTWMYRFDFAPTALRLAGLGATHGMELAYVFGRVDSPGMRKALSLGGARAAAGLEARMQAVWGTFARHGTAGWERYDAGLRLTRVLDATDRTVADPDAARRLAWEALAAEA